MKSILLLILAITANYLTSHFFIPNNSQVQPAKSVHSNRFNNNSHKNTFVKETIGNENIFSSIAGSDLNQTAVKVENLKNKKRDANYLFYLEQEHTPIHSVKK